MLTIQTAEWRSIVARLDDLEQQNRRLRVIGAVLMLLVAVTLVLGQVLAQETQWIEIIGVPGGPQQGDAQVVPRVPRTVKAQEFILEDAHGNRRARLGLRSGGPVSLQLYDDDGTLGAWLGSNGLGFYDEYEEFEGRHLVQLALTAGKIPHVYLYHEGNPAAVLSSNSGNPHLWLRDADSKGTATLMASRGGVQGLIFSTPNKGSATISVGQTTFPGIVSGELGKPRALLHVYPKGFPRFELVDEDGDIAPIQGRPAN